MNAYEYAQAIAQRLPMMGPHMTEMQGAMAVEGAVHKSPPPLDDVGGGCDEMADPDFYPARAPCLGEPDFHHSDVEQLLDERHKTHGSFQLNSYHGQRLREFFRGAPGWQVATAREREALDYIAGKLSRILSGQPGHRDHWLDLAGYAKLAANPNLQR